jgi:Fur family ferric uptake transcriptional regulator
MSPAQRRMTQQRQIVMEELEKLCNHPTADELYEAVKRRLPSISKGTVYRNLQILAEQDSVLTIESSGGVRHYDHNAHDHYHVQCSSCGKVADVALEEVGLPRLSKRQASGFTIERHNLELFGLCPTCQKKRREG